jgi:hypothetical protein
MIGIEMTDKLYTHTLKPVCEHEDVNMKMWQWNGVKGYIQTEKLQQIIQIS